LRYPETRGLSSNEIKIIKKDGVNSLLRDVSVRLKGSGSDDLERIGLLVDADIDLRTRWREVAEALLKAGYNAGSIPDTPQHNGTIIIERNKPIVGIWLMPDNRLHGQLEDFIGFLVPTGDAMWDRASKYVDEVMANIAETERFSNTSRSKAHVHTWLAWQKDPGTPIGFAITKRYLEPAAPHAQRLMEWVRRLFGLSA
ncbi:MAG TPA: DUF3226 domain-containing protein, partial [Chloroflexia bacterium]|nr:DUF3226 domain-containing protein [Chloroflexia bacterium]